MQKASQYDIALITNEVMVHNMRIYTLSLAFHQEKLEDCDVHQNINHNDVNQKNINDNRLGTTKHYSYEYKRFLFSNFIAAREHNYESK